MDFFVHPWFMAAGGVLISSPILIHLINRMRFKRVRWAAMEFLLKSQKRNRRRLIIEQLILLLLRILLVLLAAFLLARYLYSGAEDEGGTQHYVVLDDRLSMTDHWKDKDENKSANSFDKAKEEVVRLAQEAAKANSAQEMAVYTLSNPEKAVYSGRLNSTTSIEELTQKLAELKPTALHLSAADGITRGAEFLRGQPQSQKILHYVGDFREKHWVTGPDGDRTTKAVDQVLESGINISLLDVAFPKRSETKQIANNHDNLAIIDLTADTRVAAENVPVEFTVKLRNYSTSEKKVMIHVFINGTEDFNATKPTNDPVKAGGADHLEKFTLLFPKMKPSVPILASDAADVRELKRRAEQEFVHVRAEIEEEATGLQGDNYRDLVLEIRKRVPVLLVDGNDLKDGKVEEGGDAFHIEEALSAAKDSKPPRAYDVERCTVDQLDKINLDVYPSVYFLNVREIKDDDKGKAIVAKLAAYVKNGGSLAYFLGPKVFPTFYNETLHKKQHGLFPVLIMDKPVDALTDEERQQRMKTDFQYKILTRVQPPADGKVYKPLAPTDPDSIAMGVARHRDFLRFMLMERYYPTLPRDQWDTDRNEQVRDIFLLPNRKEIDDYGAFAQKYVNDAIDSSRGLLNDKYAPALSMYRNQVRSALQSKILYNLAAALDAMLNDPGIEKDVNRPDMKDLWKQPTLLPLKRQIEQLIETVRFGDPLVVARPYGKGHVVACLTSAGTASKWNDWAGSLAKPTWLMFMLDMQNYLTSGSGDLDRLVGDKLEEQLEQAKYSNKVVVEKMLQPDVSVIKQRQLENRKWQKAAQDILMTEFVPAGGTEKMYKFSETNLKDPGGYRFTFHQQPGDVPEEHTYAFNVDAENESDLRRAPREKLERPGQSGKDTKKGKIELHEYQESNIGLPPPHPDASESPWLYLLILVVLIVEQALAVHLSFHLHGDTKGAPAEGGAAPVAA